MGLATVHSPVLGHHVPAGSELAPRREQLTTELALPFSVSLGKGRASLSSSELLTGRGPWLDGGTTTPRSALAVAHRTVFRLRYPQVGCVRGQHLNLAATLRHMSPEEVLALLGGVATRQELRRYRVTDRRISTAVASGAVIRVRQGIYAIPLADPTAVARVAWRCEPTCLTAARRLGLPISSRDDRLHMAVASNRSMARPNAWPPRAIVVHMSHAFDGGPVTAIDVIDSTARCVSRMEQLEMVDAALNKGLMVEGDMGALRFTPARTRRWLARHCDGRSQSLLETRTRYALGAAGLKVDPQVQIPGVGRVDLVVEGTVIVETDGRETHAIASAFYEDRRRDRAALIAGYPVMRFGYADVMGDMAGVVQQVRSAVSSLQR